VSFASSRFVVAVPQPLLPVQRRCLDRVVMDPASQAYWLGSVSQLSRHGYLIGCAQYVHQPWPAPLAQLREPLAAWMASIAIVARDWCFKLQCLSLRLLNVAIVRGKRHDQEASIDHPLLRPEKLAGDRGSGQRGQLSGSGKHLASHRSAHKATRPGYESRGMLRSLGNLRMMIGAPLRPPLTARRST
jgi:hypothetical protein